MDLESLQVSVRVVARALGRHGLAGPLGHCSARLDSKRFLLCAPRAPGSIQPGEAGMVVRVDTPLPTGVLDEVRLHQQIYARRADVGGVCRVFPPATTALSTQRLIPHPRHALGALVAGIAYWDEARPAEDDALAARLAEHLGSARALVMRGNGAVTVGTSLELALAHAYCLEDAARVEQVVLTTKDTTEEECVRLNEEEVRVRQASSASIFARLHEFLIEGDPERGQVKTAS